MGDCQAGRGETPKRSRIEEREKGQLLECRLSPSLSHDRKYRVFVIPEEAVIYRLAGYLQLVDIYTPSWYWHCLGWNVQGSKHTASHCHIHMSMYPLLCSTATLQLLRYLNNKCTQYPPNPIITQGCPPSQTLLLHNLEDIVSTEWQMVAIGGIEVVLVENVMHTPVWPRAQGQCHYSQYASLFESLSLPLNPCKSN